MTAARRPFVYPPPPPSSFNNGSTPSPPLTPNSKSKSRSRTRKKSPAPPPRGKNNKRLNTKTTNNNNNNHSVSNSNSGSNSSSIESPKSVPPFSPKSAGDEMKDNTMPTIDESQTQSKLHINNNDEYSQDSMYSSQDDLDDNDHDDLKESSHKSPRSPSISVTNLDKAQQYKQFGPTIKLSTEHSARDLIRYSAMNKQRLSSKFANGTPKTRLASAQFANMGHARGIDSIGTNFILNNMNSNHDKGYNSDGSDESVSMISQSYGAYLFDANYKTRMASRSRGPVGGLQLSF